MAKYRVQIDPPMPDRERIAASRDFDSLYKQYQTQARFEFWRNLYRKPRNFAILVMVIAVGALVIDSNDPEMKPTFSVQPLDTLVFESPALESFTLTSAEVQTVEIEEMTSLEIPARAWQDEEGKEVLGPIQLHAQYVHGPTEWFQAGLPLQPEGQMNQLNALHLYATQNGQKLSLRPEKPIRVSWLVHQNPEEIAFFRLDSAKENWLEIHQTNQVALAGRTFADAPKPKRPDLSPPTTSALPVRPSQPFGIELRNPDEYPELASYRQTFWAYVDQTGSVNPWEAGLIDADDPWENVRVEKKGEGLYELKFSKAVQSTGRMQVQRVMARPMLQAQNQADATRLYRQMLADWQAQVHDIQAKDSLLKAEYEASLSAYETELTQWENAQHQEVEPSTEWRISYELAEITTSGYWQPLASDTQKEVSLGDEMEDLALWLPWCYAVQGEAVHPVELEGETLLIPAETQKIWLRADTLVRVLDLTTLP